MSELAASNWVREILKDRPASHGIQHIERVVQTAIKISQLEGADQNLVELIAWLHDVTDHKYSQDLRPELTKRYGHKITLMIEAISFSKQITSTLWTSLPMLNDSERLVVRIVRDADRIDAIGLAGLERCRSYIREKHPEFSESQVEEALRQHFHEKLERLYAENFIETPSGRQIAQPLHEAMCEKMRQH